ncbi:Diacylglycerol kinase [Caballeronia glathei]|jgi:diacylglycerol kinase (ATP)|uniref:Diacylglycerol kinase n=2 Tax=Caballeronia glathei TaxID=60547 RepID=A0A069PE18_9BURK|nr:diacylglycerol kinase [Paraburkholderia sp. BL8N3]KDR38757.1 DeoR faimly transcriptional regulator [Caballeronia glathei]TCK44203.1 diacylglycerol kinase (ATP) [Paraburkholderia sp. BL8N3]CDY79563.1 Diacylglycerol kinase [Caballeronia glathei]
MTRRAPAGAQGGAASRGTAAPADAQDLRDVRPRAPAHDDRPAGDGAAPERGTPPARAGGERQSAGSERQRAGRANIGAMRDPFNDDPDDADERDDPVSGPQRAEPLSPDDPLAPLPFNPYKGNRGVTRAWHAMKNSLNGFRVAIREESAFRQELTLAAILVPCGIAVPVTPVERAALFASVLLVLIVELLNSSVEAAIDRISLERHELSKRAKDFGSAAVMVALAVCVLTWALIVGPLVWHWLARIS